VPDSVSPPAAITKVAQDNGLRYRVTVATHPVELRPSVRSPERYRLERRARVLAWGANAWHLVEFAIAVGAGIAAGSVALIAFGIDSLIEVLAGGVIVWLFTGGRGQSAAAERTAQRIIAVSFYALAMYVVVESVRSFTGDHPEASWVGIGLAAVTAPTMPFLARAKRRIGRELGSRATQSEGAQNMVCAYLSVALLIGLGANEILGWWWADPLAGLVIAGIAVREGREAWRGEDACGCCC
jgi:divalent metal cation (Fe/Co/Zn/Cd) transporter